MNINKIQFLNIPQATSRWQIAYLKDNYSVRYHYNNQLGLDLSINVMFQSFFYFMRPSFQPKTF